MASSLDTLFTAVVATGQTASSIFNPAGQGVVSIQTDAAFAGMSITFKVAIDPGALDNALVALKNQDGTTYTVTTAASQAVTLPAGDLIGFSRVQAIVTAPAGPTTITFGVRPV